MWSNGYHVPEYPDRLRLESIPAAGEFVRTFGRLAAQLDMAIAITFLERYEPSARNTVVLFDRHGKKAFTYAKVHTCDFDVERNLTPGEDFYVAQLLSLIHIWNACLHSVICLQAVWNRLSREFVFTVRKHCCCKFRTEAGFFWPINSCWRKITVSCVILKFWRKPERLHII